MMVLKSLVRNQYHTCNFYENSGVNGASIGANNIETLNNFPIEKTIELFEKLLQKEKTKFEISNK